jgi:hypothetical protein
VQGGVGVAYDGRRVAFGAFRAVWGGFGTPSERKGGWLRFLRISTPGGKTGGGEDGLWSHGGLRLRSWPMEALAIGSVATRTSAQLVPGTRRGAARHRASMPTVCRGDAVALTNLALLILWSLDRHATPSIPVREIETTPMGRRGRSTNADPIRKRKRRRTSPTRTGWRT